MRPFRNAILGFAAAPFLAAVALAVIDARRVNPAREFPTVAQAVAFDLFLWGVLFVIFSGGAFAATVAWTVPARMTVPLPLVTGFVAGAAAVAMAGSGITNMLVRNYQVPGLVAIALPGLLTGMAVFLVCASVTRT